MTKTTQLLSSALALIVSTSACMDASDDAGGASPGGGGKADDPALALRGAWGHFVYQDGRIVQSGTLLFTYDQDHLRLRIGAFDHAVGTEGYLVHEPFALDAGFAEVAFAPDCTLYFAHEGRAIEVMQAGPCEGAVPPSMTLDGTYLIDRGVARIDTYRPRDSRQTGDLTLVTSGQRVEFAIGVRPRSALSGPSLVGTMNGVTGVAPAEFVAAADCRLTFEYIGANLNIERVRVRQVGACADATGGSGLTFAGDWDLAE